MKVTVFKNQKERLSRDYCLTNISIDELEKALKSHCEVVEVNPCDAAIEIEIEDCGCKSKTYVVKGTSAEMSMRQVALEILSWEMAA